jgi:ATP-dependent DNA helicase RecG
MIDAAVLSAGGGGIEEQLASLRFLALASGRPTYAAILAIGKEPAKFVPGAIVQFVRYEGADASTKVLASCELTGTIRELVEETVDELRGQLRTPQPDFPIEALRELLVNAIVHRNYESRQVPVSIRWFRDRIEIQNPGGLYGAVRRENFDRVNDYRNPVVAEAARAFGYVERFGSGISLVQAALRENGNPPADWIFEGTYTLAVVRPRR